MKLIEYDGVDFKIADEALLVKPIRELFQKDKTQKKESFWHQMSYLWFMCDPRSPYRYLTDDDMRSAEVKQQEGFEESWTPSALLKEAMDIYKRMSITTQSLLLEDIRVGIDNVRSFFREVDVKAVDKKTGKPIYQISSVTNAIKQALELSKMLAEAERELAKDYESEEKGRGNAEKAVYESI